MPAPLIIPSGSGVTGVTLQTYRSRLAETLGYYASGTVTTQATSLEAERYILSSSMASDFAPPEQLDGLFVYIRSGAQAGSQRRLVSGGWDGPLGALMVDYPYSSALLVGSGFELSVLPAARYQGMSGLTDIINQSLETLSVIDKLPITVTATSNVPDTQYSLSGYSWPIKSIRAVYATRTSATSEPRRLAAADWEFDQDAESPVLSFLNGAPGNVGDSFEVEFLRPANTRIKQSGVWGDATTGLVNEADEALYDVNTVVLAARPIALKRLAQMYAMGSKERGELLGMAQNEEQQAAFSRFFSQFRGNGAQKVGSRGGGRGQRYWSRV